MTAANETPVVSDVDEGETEEEQQSSSFHEEEVS